MKNPAFVKNHLWSSCGALFFCAFCGVFVWSPAARTEASIKGGIEGGYSLLTTSSDVEEKFLNGGGLGFHLQLHFNESWAIFLDGDWARFPEYQLLLSSQGFLTPPIRDLRLLGGAVGALYKLDVMNITPWVGLGYAFLSYDRTVMAEEQSFFDTGIRLEFGADYRWTPWFEVGLVLRSDIRLTGESPYSTHLDMLARATVIWSLQ